MNSINENNGWITGRNGTQRVNTIEKYQYLVGTKINKWTVIDIVHNRRHPDAICVCECGTTKPVNIRNLINNQSKDCGCGRKKMLSETRSKDLIGQRFGRLVVEEALPDTNKFNRKVYLCRCDCGNEIYVPSSSLTTNHTLSCGCLLSYYNTYIAQILTDAGICYMPEYAVEIDGVRYRFDFYLPDYNLFIEYDGQQHFNARFYIGKCKSEDDGMRLFERAQLRDSIKNKYCADNNINILRIPYWESNNIKTIINDCLQRLNERGSVSQQSM